MAQSLVALVHGRNPSRTEARATVSQGRRPGPVTMYGLPVSRVRREDAASPVVLTRVPRSTSAASTVLATHWFDDRSFADLVADAPTDMGALIRSTRR